MNDAELKAKISIVSHAFSLYSEREDISVNDKIEIARSFLCNIFELNIDEIPLLMVAARTLNVSMDFLTDYNKLQYLYDNGDAFKSTISIIDRSSKDFDFNSIKKQKTNI